MRVARRPPASTYGLPALASLFCYLTAHDALASPCLRPRPTLTAAARLLEQRLCVSGRHLLLVLHLAELDLELLTLLRHLLRHLPLRREPLLRRTLHLVPHPLDLLVRSLLRLACEDRRLPLLSEAIVREAEDLRAHR